MYPFNHKYPGTDLHEIDLAYTIEEVEKLKDRLENFIKYNKLEISDPFEWNIASQYRTMTLVKDPDSGMVYVSLQPVPAGVQITNTEYWMYIGYGEADPQVIEHLQQAVDAMQQDVDDINTEFNTINENIDTLQSDLVDLETDVNNLTGTVSGQGNRLTMAEGNITNLTTKVNTNISNITNLTGRMNTAETNVTSLQNNKANRSGDTFTGSVAVRSSNLDGNNPPSSAQNGNYVSFQDTSGNNLGVVRIREGNDGQIRLRLIAQEPGGQTNELGLSVNADGTKGIATNAAAAWKTALGYMNADDAVRASGSSAFTAESGFSLSRATLVRFGHLVYFTALISGPITPSFVSAGTIPVGYRPAAAVDGPVGCTGSNARFSLNTSGTLQVAGTAATGQSMAINASWYIS